MLLRRPLIPSRLASPSLIFRPSFSVLRSRGMASKQHSDGEMSIEYTPERAEELRENIEGVQREIKEACKERKASGEPRLVAVSKLKPASDIHALYAAGHRHFGENYIQELVDKARALPLDIDWHFIGALQSNKAKAVAAIPNLWVLETLANIKVADLLDKARKHNDLPPLGVYIQINTSAEDAKAGVPALTEPLPADQAEGHELVALATHVLTACPNLKLRGLMTIGAYEASHTAGPNPDFTALVATRQHLLAALRERNVPGVPDSDDAWELSMGMSADFAEAVRMGSAGVRVGTRIFGERPKKVKVGDQGGATK